MITYVVIPEERIKILRHKKEWIEEIEKLSKTKIEFGENQQMIISGEDPISVMRVRDIIRALGRGFDYQSALNLLDEEYFLEIINLKEFAKTRNRQIELKGRVIGSEGSAKQRIEEMTNTKIAVHGKTISIIGKWNDVQKAREAIEMLLKGAMHNTVYRFLERSYNDRSISR